MYVTVSIIMLTAYMNSIVRRIYCLGFVLLFLLRASAQDASVGFPKEIVALGGQVITLYQPQPENFTGNKITGRSAISVRKSIKSEPIFGAIFYEATIETDKATRIAECRSIKITRVKFPDIDDKKKTDSLIKLIEAEVPKWNLRISLDALVATIKQDNGTVSDNFNNNPPKIIYRNKLTTLVYIDGEPKVQEDKNLELERVINTPFLMLKDKGEWYLYSAGVWYESDSIKTGWKPNKKLTKKLKKVNEKIKEDEAKNKKAQSGGKEETPTVTDILVSTVPAELLQTKGEASFKTIQGTSLLYASNTTSQIFKDINTQKTYTLLSGRWYHAASLAGPWSYIASDKLPADFAKIPEGSDKDEVLASVAGTKAAEEARIDAQIPQTAKVSRKDASIKVQYDGNPVFKPIEGTSLQLAENSNVTVIKEKSGKYYAVENGVWFRADNAKGPWVVADERPADVSKIPASSEAYNTKYVYVYESTLDHVYVGYTPGYTGCYVHGSTVIYGTGYHYAPWYGTVYYPAPVTWGMGFSYNPWTGWGMSVGFSTGYMSIGFSFGGYGGWYGPPMYYPPYRPPYYGGGYYGGGNGNRIHNGDINIDEINIGNNGNRNQINNGLPGGGNRNQVNNGLPGGGNRNNIYNNQSGVSTMDKQRQGSRNQVNNSVPGGSRGQTGVNNQLPKQNGGQIKQSRESNNVFTDRDGNVYQKDNKGNWSQRDNRSNSWKSSGNSPSTSNMNRESQNRDRGNMRTNNYQQRSMPSSGARMGGGGGRRR
jgi:hypothetical protein